jgi:ABC-type siderophore export system fused ATPase/permease subunit
MKHKVKDDNYVDHDANAFISDGSTRDADKITVIFKFLWLLILFVRSKMVKQVLVSKLQSKIVLCLNNLRDRRCKEQGKYSSTKP